MGFKSKNGNSRTSERITLTVAVGRNGIDGLLTGKSVSIESHSGRVGQWWGERKKAANIK